MRIVQFLWNMDFADGGVVRAVTDLCPMLARAGHHVTLVCCRGNATVDGWTDGWSEDEEASPRVVKIETPRRMKWLSRLAVADTALAGFHADVMHIHGMWVACNWQVARMCGRFDLPYVFSPHGMLDDWPMSQHAARKRLLLGVAYRNVLERAAAVHCTSIAEREQASKHFPRGRADVVPLPMNLTPFREMPGAELARRELGLSAEGPPVVLSIGRLHHKKGVHLLLDAARLMKDRGREIRVIVAGEGDAEYAALLREKAAGLAVTFVGFVNGAAKLSLYQCADVVCLPTSQENFGYAVVEGLAAGRAVLTTRGVALWPELEQARAAMECEQTAKSIAAGLERLVGDAGLRASMGERARAWCFERLDSPNAVAGFVDMYARAAAARGGRK